MKKIFSMIFVFVLVFCNIGAIAAQTVVEEDSSTTIFESVDLDKRVSPKKPQKKVSEAILNKE